jgi:hypothetical protein
MYPNTHRSSFLASGKICLGRARAIWAERP